MSNRAVEAYEEHKRPMSKWNKEAFKEAFEYHIENEEYDLTKELAEELLKLPLTVLKSEVLEYKEWHHTGKFFNETDFYGIRNDIAEYTPTELKNKYNEKKAEKAREEKEYQEYLENGKRRTEAINKTLEENKERFKDTECKDLYIHKTRFEK